MDAKLRTSASLIALTVGVVGCGGSLTESRSIDYQSARSVERSLEVPPDLTAPRGDGRYSVPSGVATYSGFEREQAERPRATATGQVLTDVENMRIERAGSQRWLVVDGSADELWPQLKEFWMELGFVINVDRPEVGVMETDWAEDRAQIPEDFVRRTLGRLFDNLFSTNERDKFRTRVEQGEEPGSTEVFISHRGMEEVVAGRDNERTVWQPRDPDAELEAEMLRRLMIYLGEDEDRAERQVADEGRTVQDRAAIQSQDGRDVLVLNESFDRAWRRVGLALDRTGFAVQDRDRSEGVYFVRYIDPESDARSQRSEGGVMSRLAFWRSDEPGEIAEGDQYRIRVGGDASESQVDVLNDQGEPSRSRTARRIVNLLHEQLR